MAVGAYFALGAVVLASRLLFPNIKQVAAVEQPIPHNDEQELPKAA
jgi:hypothetical protein